MLLVTVPGTHVPSSQPGRWGGRGVARGEGGAPYERVLGEKRMI